jgi:hypothetical protein
VSPRRRSWSRLCPPDWPQNPGSAGEPAHGKCRGRANGGTERCELCPVGGQAVGKPDSGGRQGAKRVGGTTRRIGHARTVSRLPAGTPRATLSLKAMVDASLRRSRQPSSLPGDPRPLERNGSPAMASQGSAIDARQLVRSRTSVTESFHDYKLLRRCERLADITAVSLYHLGRPTQPRKPRTESRSALDHSPSPAHSPGLTLVAPATRRRDCSPGAPSCRSSARRVRVTRSGPRGCLGRGGTR